MTTMFQCCRPGQLTHLLSRQSSWNDSNVAHSGPQHSAVICYHCSRKSNILLTFAVIIILPAAICLRLLSLPQEKKHSLTFAVITVRPANIMLAFVIITAGTQHSTQVYNIPLTFAIITTGFVVAESCYHRTARFRMCVLSFVVILENEFCE